jgi:lipopolysaccharide export LptBFGC system permease protein LptF
MNLLNKIKNILKLGIDIGTIENPELSNFNNYNFVFYGQDIHSMEGLLQGIKYEDRDKQKAIFLTHGKEAKFKGKKSKWYKTQTLYFQGQALKRDSVEYQNFLEEAFYTLYLNNPVALKALLNTKNKHLRHSIGKNDITRTVLTENEFCTLLMSLRKKLNSDF